MTTYPESHKYGAALTQSGALNTVKTSSRQGGNHLTTDSGFAPGQPYFEIYAASGPDALQQQAQSDLRQPGDRRAQRPRVLTRWPLLRDRAHRR